MKLAQKCWQRNETDLLMSNQENSGSERKFVAAMKGQCQRVTFADVLPLQAMLSYDRAKRRYNFRFNEKREVVT